MNSFSSEDSHSTLDPTALEARPCPVGFKEKDR